MAFASFCRDPICTPWPFGERLAREAGRNLVDYPRMPGYEPGSQQETGR